MAAWPLCSTGPYAPQLATAIAIESTRSKYVHMLSATFAAADFVGSAFAGASTLGAGLAAGASATGAAWGGPWGAVTITTTAPSNTIISPAKNQGPISFISPAR